MNLTPETAILAYVRDTLEMFTITDPDGAEVSAQQVVALIRSRMAGDPAEPLQISEDLDG